MTSIVEQAQAILSSLDPKSAIIKKLVRLRSTKRQALTRTLNTLKVNFPDDESQINFYLEKLRQIKTGLGTYDDQIMDKILDGD